MTTPPAAAVPEPGPKPDPGPSPVALPAGESDVPGSPEAVAAFFQALGEASRRLAHSRIEQTLADEHGLDLLAYRLMLHLRADGIRVGDLARTVVAHASHTSRALAVLEARGWITRHPTAADRRVVVIRPTPTGWTTALAIRTDLHAALAERVAAWTESELRSAAAAMRRLSDAL